MNNNTKIIKNIKLKSLDSTKDIANLLVGLCLQNINNNIIIYLTGNLGSGKTTFSQFFIKGLGCTDNVKSPTYTLIETYNLKEHSGFNIYHLDLYRLSVPDELDFLGLEDFINNKSTVVLIEWPDKGENLLPEDDMSINMSYENDERRMNIVVNDNCKLESIDDFVSKVSNYL